MIMRRMHEVSFLQKKQHIVHYKHDQTFKFTIQDDLLFSEN